MKNPLLGTMALILAGVVIATAASNSSEPQRSKLVSVAANGKLVYSPDARGNTIPDYSYAGYMAGGVALPVAPVKVTLHPQPASTDDSPRIQAAIDQISKLTADKQG